MMKYYEFKYPSRSIEKFEKSAYLFSNIVIPFAVFIVVDFLLHKTPVTDFEWYSVARKIVLVLCIVVSYLLFKKFLNNPKGVFVYDNYISIDRQAISYWHLSKMNFTIDIKDIRYFAIEKRDSSNYAARYYNMLGGIGSPFVQIKTEKKTYCFCIENQEEFFYEVKKKIELINGADRIYNPENDSVSYDG